MPNVSYEFNLFPACAGVILEKTVENCKQFTFPRVCGGDPVSDLENKDSYGLFPACAGVILNQNVENLPDRTFPRVCGGDPVGSGTMEVLPVFSPRVRG